MINALRQCVPIVRNLCTVEHALLGGSLVCGAFLLCAARQAPGHAWLGWFCLFPLFVAIRVLRPAGAALCGALWGLSLCLFLGGGLPSYQGGALGESLPRYQGGTEGRRELAISDFRFPIAPSHGLPIAAGRAGGAVADASPPFQHPQATVGASPSWLRGSVALRLPLALILLPAVYAFLACWLTRWIGFSAFVLGTGWMLVELALSPLGLRHGLLAATQFDAWFFPVVAHGLGYVLVAFVGAYAGALLVTSASLIGCTVIAAERRRSVDGRNFRLCVATCLVTLIAAVLRSLVPRGPPVSCHAVGCGSASALQAIFSRARWRADVQLS